MKVNVFGNKLKENSKRLLFWLKKSWRIRKSTVRVIRKKPFKEGDVKVKDHDHIDGKYRGPAHQDCNINLSLTINVLVVFHKFQNYD